MISFEEMFPEYTNKWDYEKNEKLPSEVSYGSGTKYWWKCKKGHSWLSSPNTMSRGTECPYCSGLFPIIGETDLATTHPEILKLWNYKENNKMNIMPTDVKYGSKKKVYWICDNGHTWLAPVQRIVIENRHCPYCSNQKVLEGYNDLATKFPELLDEWDYSKNVLTPNNVLSGSTKKVWWKCKKCGYEWNTAIIHRTGIHKTNCPKCAPKINRDGQLFRKIIKEGSFGDNYPDLLKEWDFEKNKDINPFQLVSKSAKKVHWKCRKGHEWEAVIVSRTRKNGTGCPICAGKKVQKGFNDFESQQPILIKEWDNNKNDKINLYPDNITCHSERKAWWLCPSCGNSYKAKICNRVNGTACPECSNELKTSFPEQAIYYYFSKIFKTENRYDINGLEIDIYIPELLVGIEYDGELYHISNKALTREKSKYEKLKSIGITLIRVKENFNNYNIKSYADYTIEIKKNNYDQELPKVIKKIISYLSKNYKLNINLKINLKGDRQEIYSQYIKQKKENSVAKLYSEKIKDWDYSKNKIKPDNITPGSLKRIWWKCDKGHSYESSLVNHIKHNSKCPYCRNLKVLKGYNDLLTTNPKLESEWNYDKNTIRPDEVVEGSNKNVWWKCNNCGYEWKSRPHDRSRRNSKCPKCHN